jgi:hypothetical protein
VTTRYDNIYRKAARLHGVPFELLKAQGFAESGWNPKAVSYRSKYNEKTGKRTYTKDAEGNRIPLARGIAQFIQSTGKKYGLKKPSDYFDPEKAINAQAEYMRDIYDSTGQGDWGLSVAEYNMGPNLHKRGVEMVFDEAGAERWETAKYTRKILNRSGIQSSVIPMEGGVMAKGQSYADAYKKLDDEEKKLQKLLALESDDVSFFESDSLGAYDAASESPDLSLMRELAKRAYEAEESASPSNVAAQFAMLMNPNFAPVFKDATTRRINAARNYFNTTGAIARQAQSERSARAQARSRKKSPARLQNIAGSIRQLQQARRDLMRQELAEQERAKEGRLDRKNRRNIATAKNVSAEKRKGMSGEKVPLLNVQQKKRQGEADLAKYAKQLEMTDEQKMLDKMIPKDSSIYSKPFYQTDRGIEVIENYHEALRQRRAAKILENADILEATAKQWRQAMEQAEEELQLGKPAGPMGAEDNLLKMQKALGKKQETP